MQKDFIDGSLANEDAKAIIGAVIVEIREWKGYVFYTMDTHGADFKQTLEGVLPEHCIKGTEGWKFEESIQQALDDAYATRIEKPTFGYLGWAKYFLGDDASMRTAPSRARKSSQSSARNASSAFALLVLAPTFASFPTQ